jgi:AraC-like DNA-binding protein
MGQRSNRMLVTFQKEGVALVQQDGRESRVEAGDIFMIDPARPFFIETGEILTHSVYLKPDALRSLIPNINDYTARVIDGRSGTGSIFASMLDSVFSLASSLDEGTADRISESLPYVFTAAISGIIVSDPAGGDSRLRQLHRLRVLRYIRDHLCESDMSASSIGTAVGLSTRYIYELFASEDQPLMRSVWNMRLDRCRAELAAASSLGRSIGEIAYYWGFNDLAHFSRSFRQRYGRSPREYRKESTGRTSSGY